MTRKCEQKGKTNSNEKHVNEKSKRRQRARLRNEENNCLIVGAFDRSRGTKTGTFYRWFGETDRFVATWPSFRWEPLRLVLRAARNLPERQLKRRKSSWMRRWK